MTLITPGQAGDSPMFLPLLAHLRVARDVGRPRTRPDAVRGDKAYSSRAIRGHLRARGIRAVIPALVIAVTVSLISGLITTFGAGANG